MTQTQTQSEASESLGRLRVWINAATDGQSPYHTDPEHGHGFDPDLFERDAKAVVEWCESLAKFKAYVHGRLDAAGVPVDPESPHRAEGCRIGGRLDWVLSQTLKPLEWRLLRDDADATIWGTDTVFGSIRVEREIGDDGDRTVWRFCFDEFYDEGQHECRSIEEGKGEAEAFYRKRIAPWLAGAAA